MSKHAKYSPSKLARILSCPASGNVTDSEESSVYANEGTMLHDVTADCLECVCNGSDWIKMRDAADLTNEQDIAVEECVIYAMNLMVEMQETGGYTSLIEQHVKIAKDCSGTADLIIYNDNELHIVDWKFGQGIEVSANENTQLMAYARGAQQTFCPEATVIVLHVVQPRLNNFDMYTLSSGNLERWFEHTLLPGLAECEKPFAEYKPSLEACRWCPLRTTCQARLSKAFTDAEDVFAEHAKLPEIDTDVIAELIEKAKEIEQVIKDLKLHATKLLSDGKEVKGLKLVAGRSIRQWVDEASAIEFMSSRRDFEDLFTQKFISPAQAEKLLGREAKKDEDFQAQIFKPEGKPTLAPESDKRQPLNLSAESAFDNYKE